MYTYINEFFQTFTGLTSDLTSLMSELVTVFLTITVLYLLFKIPFPKDTFIKKSGFFMLYLMAAVFIFYTNGYALFIPGVTP